MLKYVAIGRSLAHRAVGHSSAACAARLTPTIIDHSTYNKRFVSTDSTHKSKPGSPERPSVGGFSQLPVFELEQHPGWTHAQHQLCASDCEPLSLHELLALADDECRQLWEQLSLGYPPDTRGHPLLRSEIAATYSAAITPDDVTVCAPAEGILLAMNAILRPGDHVVAMAPAYQSLLSVAASIGCEVTLWEPYKVQRPDEGLGSEEELRQDLRFDVERLEQVMRLDTRLVITNCPHNPTGWHPTPPQWAHVADLCSQVGAYLFSDEMYRGLEHSPGGRLQQWREAEDSGTTLSAACELYERGVALGGLSKSFGAAGLRIGWLASRDRSVVRRARELKDFTTICAAAPSEALAVAALRNREALWARCNAIIRRNIALLDASMLQRPHLFDWSPPMAGPVAFPRLRGGYSASDYSRRLVEGYGLMVLPSHLFDYGDERIRVGLGRENFPDMLALWEQAERELLSDGLRKRDW